MGSDQEPLERVMTDRLTREELDRLSELEAKATKSPWTSFSAVIELGTVPCIGTQNMVRGVNSDRIEPGRVCEVTDLKGRHTKSAEDDLDFIALLRNSARALIAAARRDAGERYTRDYRRVAAERGF